MSSVTPLSSSPSTSTESTNTYPASRPLTQTSISRSSYKGHIYLVQQESTPAPTFNTFMLEHDSKEEHAFSSSKHAPTPIVCCSVNVSDPKLHSLAIVSFQIGAHLERACNDMTSIHEKSFLFTNLFLATLKLKKLKDENGEEDKHLKVQINEMIKINTQCRVKHLLLCETHFSQMDDPNLRSVANNQERAKGICTQLENTSFEDMWKWGFILRKEPFNAPLCIAYLKYEMKKGKYEYKKCEVIKNKIDKLWLVFPDFMASVSKNDAYFRWLYDLLKGYIKVMNKPAKLTTVSEITSTVWFNDDGEEIIIPSREKLLVEEWRKEDQAPEHTQVELQSTCEKESDIDLRTLKNTVYPLLETLPGKLEAFIKANSKKDEGELVCLPRHLSSLILDAMQTLKKLVEHMSSTSEEDIKEKDHFVRTLWLLGRLVEKVTFKDYTLITKYTELAGTTRQNMWVKCASLKVLLYDLKN